MLKEHIPRVIHHQVYNVHEDKSGEHTQVQRPPLGQGVGVRIASSATYDQVLSASYPVCCMRGYFLAVGSIRRYHLLVGSICG